MVDIDSSSFFKGRVSQIFYQLSAANRTMSKAANQGTFKNEADAVSGLYLDLIRYQPWVSMAIMDCASCSLSALLIN
ncbi:hypothetical protein SAMN05192529_106149 [Arachidicoccus rhizosphaerae]|uniref:Uncharacterized protein n=1 Tax=Arachidicoccus rhizosphaerae TaxID=551991 RepID=A0A1H3XV30_9BACT|nr:hypothetical protein SAMN05192529_106149 [Arachidicoccus rhizosphaerae]